MPEETEKTIRVPTGMSCQVTATIDISKSEGIKALYCGQEKQIRTYLFDKEKDWTMAKAKTWVKDHRVKEATRRTYDKIEDYFHNYEHSPEGLNHCHSEGKHPYTVKHNNGKHEISNNIARGHGLANSPQWFKFTKKLGDGWDLDSGKKIEVPKESKEAKMITEISEAMSDNDKRTLLQAAVVDSIAIGNDSHGPWIRDVYDTELVYEIGGKMYKMAYVIDRKGKTVFGEAEKVTPQTVYTPVQEAVESKVGELTEAAAGRENGHDTSATTDKLLALLEKETLTEAEAEPVMVEADALISKLAEAAPAKTEDGAVFPRAAYAYTPDPELSSTWKLRLWEDLDKKVTRAQLGRAAAALSPGGFRGQKVAIPSADLSAVKRKIRGGYRSLEVPDEAIPKWVKESETRELLVEFMALSEAKIDGKGIAEIDIIAPGFNSDGSRYYPADMLAHDFAIFEGVKMYADHPTKEEDRQRPERSIRDWVATLSDVHVDESTGKLKGKATIVESWFKEKLSNLRDQGLLGSLGVSINAIGKGVKSKIEGKSTTVIEKLLQVRSVDFVTEPGAGGIVIAYESAGADVDLIDVEAFRDRRPDLVTEIESAIETKIQTEVKAKMEQEEKVKELEGQVETLTTERDQLKEVATEAEKEKAKADAQATIKGAVDKAELPDAAKTRLIEAHKDDESAEGIDDIIKSEAAYIASLTETGKIKDLGPSGDPDHKVGEKLEEAFTELTGSEEAGKVAAKGR